MVACIQRKSLLMGATRSYSEWRENEKNIILVSILLLICFIPINTFGKGIQDDRKD